MSNESSRPESPLQSRNALILAATVVLCVFVAAYFLWRSEYLSHKKEILAVQDESLSGWVRGTAEAMRQWNGDLETQAKRVSSSELYRLFASEASQLSTDAAAALNDPEHVQPTDSMAALAEQVPLMRNVLMDFMNFNGMSDARLVNAQGQTILSALSMPPPLSNNQRIVSEQAIKRGATMYAPVRATGSGLMLDMVDPLRSVLSQDDESKPVAALLLTMPVTNSIARLLGRPIPRNTDAKAYLVQRRGDQWEEISVLGTRVLPDSVELPEDDTTLSFKLRTGVNGEQVYSLGRRLPGQNWWLIIEEPVTVVDALLRADAISVGLTWGLASAGFVLVLSLFWWVVVGRNQRAVSDRLQHLYEVIQRQKHLLDSINVSLDLGLVMADVKGQLLLCNRAFSQIIGRPESELEGETLTSVLPGDAAVKIVDGIRAVAETRATVSVEVEVPSAEEARLYRVTLYPFVDNAENASNTASTPGAVGVFQDITQFRRMSEKRRRQQIGTIAALVKAIEGVDPYLAGHSAMMVELASLVCAELYFSKDDAETVRIAASLSQIGKLFLPRELLTKTTPPSPEEQVLLMKAPEQAHAVLKDVDFSLPVPQAVYEMYERPDGSGYPRHITSEAISMHARVLAVLNAFCAMASPRSYRSSLPSTQILENLRSAPGAFDQTVVEALAAVVSSGKYRGPGSVSPTSFMD